MNAERVVAVLAVLMAFGLFASVPGAVSDYRQSSDAYNWQTAYGRVIERTDVTLPSFYCFVRDTRYSLIRYNYTDSKGNLNFGAAQAPIRPDIYLGSTIEIRFNQKEMSQSFPVDSISAYVAASRGLLIAFLPFALAFLYAARRLWHDGTQFPSKLSVPQASRDDAVQRRAP